MRQQRVGDDVGDDRRVLSVLTRPHPRFDVVVSYRPALVLAQVFKP
jgi:hypothetical protein